MTDTSQGAAAPTTLDIIKPFAAAAFRHVLTAAGGALVTGGYVSSSTSAQLIGAGMTLGGLAWSWYEKRGRAQLIATIGDLRAILRQRADQARAQQKAHLAGPVTVELRNGV